MKDKKNIIIAVLIGIIILGIGYMLGAKKSSKEPTNTSISTIVDEESNTSSSTLVNDDTSSFEDVELTEKTSESSVIIQEQTDEQIAFNKMISLSGTWAVWQSDNNFTIHPDGSWTTRSVGPGGDRSMNVEALSYDETNNLLTVSIDGTITTLQINNDKEITVDSGRSGGSSNFILIEK